MLKTKKVMICGEETDAIDVNVGDSIGVAYDDSYDSDFNEWCSNYKGALIVTDVDYEMGMVWLKDCPYGVEMGIISDVYPKNEISN